MFGYHELRTELVKDIARQNDNYTPEQATDALTDGKRVYTSSSFYVRD
jgi:hypothetical protein